MGYPKPVLKNKTSAMLHVEWTEVKIMQQLGKILDYNLVLANQSGSDLLKVNTTLRYFLFQNLKHFTVYNITVKARNSMGYGPSRMILGKTGEDGKVICLLLTVSVTGCFHHLEFWKNSILFCNYR